MHKSALLGLLASSPVSAQLHSLAQAAGLKYFGSAVDNGYLSDAAYAKLANNVEEFGQLVPENGQKWETVEPTRDQFTYTTADVVPDLAKKNKQILRCHALTWHSQLPSWVEAGKFSKSELTEIIEAHIANVVEHYKGDCYAWDVVNEAIDDSGEWRDSVFYQTLGTDFLAISFNAAKKADPDAKLYYNDYNLEQNGKKTDRAVEIVEILQKAGAPIDGVGFQGHLIVGQSPSRSEMATVFERFTALNVEVAFTELDIRHSAVPASAAALAKQGDEYANMVGACLDVKGCVGVTVWGITDKYSWIPDVFKGTGEALLYSDKYEKKPAWTSVSSLLAAAATGAPISSTIVPTAKPTTMMTMTKPAYTETDDCDELPETEEPAYPTSMKNSSAPATTMATRTALGPVYTNIDDNDDDCEDETEAPFPTYIIPTNGTSTLPTKAPVYDDDEDCDDDSAPAPIYDEDEDCEDDASAPVEKEDDDCEEDGDFEPTAAAISTAAAPTRAPVVRTSSAYTYKWNTQTRPSYAAPSGTAPAGPVGTGNAGPVKQYYQCGGKNWTGATECEKPYKCVEMNPYYHQCVKA
ncbi:glycoside hydrolase superfamily [Fusarium flagelliforme]|nr:glycoside hydrolase superfamily [Fusarium flagelliforme]KAH7193777.1 glycoside hydrolase superfamily [Fusarium flagelliforme]